MRENILEVKNLIKNFGNFRAINDISFTVKQGSFFSILGPSGCGKTTLLKILSGFIKESSGELYISNNQMNGISPEKRPVNIIFQNLALFPMMNVEKNIAFGLKMQKIQKVEIKKRVKEILEKVRLGGFENKKIDELSGGQKQRVAIARALVMRPKILLLDEPLSALDRQLRENMKIELKQLQKETGTTFVYITHDQSEALSMSDKIAVMNRGKFEQIDTPKNMYKNPKTPFVAEFVGENNKFEVVDYINSYLITKGNLKINIPNLKEKPKLMYIRPEFFILSKDNEEVNSFEGIVKTVLFDGVYTKLTVDIMDEKVLVSIPFNSSYDDIKIGDKIKLGVEIENIKCF
jgi:spermidine/putrescine transport system ATP-binding protein